MNQEPLDTDADEVADLAVDYVAGVLRVDERAKVDDRIAAGDRRLAEEIQNLQPLVLGLVALAGAVVPPAAVKAALLARVRAQKSFPSVVLQKAEEGKWLETPFPGIQVRPLSRDISRNVASYVLRAAPGSSLPDHHHAGPEEGYLLEGDLHTCGTIMRPGDFIRFAAGTQHGPSHTQGGCMLLVTSTIDSEVVATPYSGAPTKSG